jgi:hypothetical protein
MQSMPSVQPAPQQQLATAAAAAWLKAALTVAQQHLREGDACATANYAEARAAPEPCLAPVLPQPELPQPMLLQHSPALKANEELAHAVAVPLLAGFSVPELVINQPNTAAQQHSTQVQYASGGCPTPTTAPALVTQATPLQYNMPKLPEGLCWSQKAFGDPFQGMEGNLDLQ